MDNRLHKTEYVSTTNACKLCAPLGACIAFRGVEGAVPLVHGSQGCGTYIRRYVISHYREPMDVASSNFTEATTVFGGGPNLQASLENVTARYQPTLIGVATSCLAETIGDDVSMMLKEYSREHSWPLVVGVSTPSYSGTHIDGFNKAVKSIADAFARRGPKVNCVNVFPGFVSPADIRYLKEILSDFGLNYILLPDYSDTLDGPASLQYHETPPGGTPVENIKKMGYSRGSIQFGLTDSLSDTAAGSLHGKFGVHCCRLAMPIGVTQTDRFFRVLGGLSKRATPKQHESERGRLIDSYVDGHKYIFGKRAVVYGEEDMVVSLAAFLTEIGIIPIICASGGHSGRFAWALKKTVPDLHPDVQIIEDVDFNDICELAERLSPDILIGNSKGQQIAGRLNVPLVRVGFPIHDRIGGQRILHLGYRGAQALFDRIVNAIIEKKQSDSPVGYSYM
ncbi:MAG: nitrogenase component 1 [Armatimonadota bacterium]